MQRILWVALIAVLVVGQAAAAALSIASVSLGIHLTPTIDRLEGQRTWDLSLSVSGVAQLTSADSVECIVVVDSAPTTLGTIAEYRHDVTEHFRAGGGLTILWPFRADGRLLAPVIESYARVAGHGPIVTALRGELAMSFPAVTVANPGDGWTVVPFAALPALSISLGLAPVTGAEFDAHLTLQPVLVDTAAFHDPIGRLTDNLLVLPTVSAYLRYFPY